MDSNQKVLLVSLGIGVGVAAVVAGGVYFAVNVSSDERRRVIKTSNPVSVEMRIPIKHAGLVIGRGGETVQEIERKTETKINFKDELTTATHRVLNIRGHSDEVRLAQILIEQIIVNQPRIETVEVKIPFSATGMIIGRGGENINAMTSISNCKIEVDRGAADKDGRKTIRLRGTSEQVATAKRLVDERLAHCEVLDAEIKSTLAERQPRAQLKYRQPLFLKSEDTEEVGPVIGSSATRETYEILQMCAGDTAIPVLVSSVKDPGMFFVQKKGPGSIKLDKLVKEMTEFYETDLNRSLSAMGEDNCEVGDLVAAKNSYDGEWYRAKVFKIFKDEDDYDRTAVAHVELEFVDYGDTEKQKVSEICNLKIEFLSLSFQAIECAMADIEPVGIGWTPEAVEEFERLTHCNEWKEQLAEIKEQRRMGEKLVPMLTLMDPKGDLDIDVAGEMVRLGHAVFTKASLRRPGEKRAKKKKSQEGPANRDE